MAAPSAAARRQASGWSPSSFGLFGEETRSAGSPNSKPHMLNYTSPKPVLVSKGLNLLHFEGMLPPAGVCKMEHRSKELFQRICVEMVLPNMIILGAAISSCGVDALYGTHRVQRTVIEEHLLDCLVKLLITSCHDSKLHPE